jgi:hypothetical protein
MRTQWRSGAHAYYGKTNSRGKRFLSKLYKGMPHNNLDKAFKEVEALKCSK